MEYQITPFKPCDIEAVYEIECKSFAQPWEKKYFSLYASFRQGLPLETRVRSYARVARNNDEILGYIIWSNNERTGHGRVLNIAVREDVRRQNIGRDLMLHAVHHMREADMSRCQLEVRVSNFAAQRLYESLGMVRIGVIPKYYGDEDAIRYELAL